MKTRLEIPKDEVAEFCRRNHIRRMALFGSVLRDDFTPESDVDVLVEFEPNRAVGFAFIECTMICRRSSAIRSICTPSRVSKEVVTGCFGKKFSIRRRRCMSKRDDRMNLADMLVHAREAVEMKESGEGFDASGRSYVHHRWWLGGTG